MKDCVVCGEPFDPNHGDQVACSRSCNLANVRPTADTVSKECPECGETFSHKDWQSRKYCSKECFYNSRRSVGTMSKTCPVCGDTFTHRDDREQKTCSYSCHHKRVSEEWREENMITKTCKVCGSEFEVRPCDNGKTYCSYSCSSSDKDIFTRDVECADGHMVRSKKEKIIDDWMHENDIPHEYEPGGVAGMRPDWKVGDLYVEYWGLAGKPEYDEKIERKRATCMKENIPMLELFPKDLESLGDKMQVAIQRCG